MLMVAESIKRTTLGPIAHALDKKQSRVTLDEIDRRAAQIVARIEATSGFAEIAPGCIPHWHLALTFSGKEKRAADELRDRGFGICLPEENIKEVKRGRVRCRMKLLLPGYVLVFGWAIDNQLARIRECDGVRGVLLRDGRAFVVPDWLVNVVREVENQKRPSVIAHETSSAKSGKKVPRRWRKSLKPKEQPNGYDNEIIGVHAYSPIIEEARRAMLEDKAEDRIEAFHKALGL